MTNNFVIYTDLNLQNQSMKIPLKYVVHNQCARCFDFLFKEKVICKSVCIPWDDATVSFMPHLPDALNHLLNFIYIYMHIYTCRKL